MIFERKLPSPEEVKALYPLPEPLKNAAAAREDALKRILDGREDRFLLIVGPCSADSGDSVLRYALRLRALADRVADKIFIVPRVYTNKPRTTGEGYLGLLHQPDPAEKPDLIKGLIATRKMHLRVLRETGLSAADEMLYPEDYPYVDDLLCYAAVGARSVENQQHRLAASGIAAPVGMKNPLSGNLDAMLNAVHATQHAHSFIYRGWEVLSRGNPYAHAVLRGAMDSHGRSRPNYHYEDLLRLHTLYRERALQNPAAVVDVSHANSDKRYLEQIRIAKDVARSRQINADLRRLVKGLMIESYLEDGCQQVGGGVPGLSITDPCLGWEKTERLILELADMV